MWEPQYLTTLWASTALMGTDALFQANREMGMKICMKIHTVYSVQKFE
jgi:hypothetical protein